MDKSILMIEVPELSDEAIVTIHDFLHEVVMAFESYYCHKLKRYYQQLSAQEEDPI